MMSNSFEILAEFLRRYGDEVEGRAVVETPDEVLRQLGALARGEVPEPERRELMCQLKANPEWVARLAAEVRALRPRSGSKD